MILGFIEFGLSPIIWVMGKSLYLFWALTGSAGTAIVFISCLVALISYPLRGWAAKIESRIRDKMQVIDEKIALHAAGLKGENRFRAVEAIYEENQYHPIQSITLGLSILVMLPFLLSALFLLANNTELIGVPYIIILDLSQPDGLIAGFNLLPCIMTGVTLIDAKIRFSDDSRMFLQFSFIAIVLFALVYYLSSALVLYWTVSNMISMLTEMIRENRKAAINGN